jgi:hypothetical protein
MTMPETLNSTLDNDTESGSTPMTLTRQVLTSPVEQTPAIDDTNIIVETNLDLENIVVEDKTNDDSTLPTVNEKTLTNENPALTNSDEKNLTNEDSTLATIDEKTITTNARLIDNQISLEQTLNPPLYEDLYIPENSKIIKLVGEWKFCYSEMFEEFMMLANF